jgi:hypothetical protein
MRYRRATVKDEPKIRSIYKQQEDSFDLPISASEVAGVAVDDDDTIVGFIMVRRIAETILVLDLERNKRDRISALQECFKGALFESRIAGIDQIHAFVQDPKFAELLKKHFSFQTCIGEALIYKGK